MLIDFICLLSVCLVDDFFDFDFKSALKFKAMEFSIAA